MRGTGRLAFAFVLALAACLRAARGDATMLVRQASLEEITAEADRIAHGTVVEVHTGRDETGVPSTWITLDVLRPIKGRIPHALTFKQFGAATPLPDGTLAQVPGLPRYHPGETVLLFLHADSARGFTSPVGLGQGVYRVDTTSGRATVRRDGDGVPEDLDVLLDRVERAVRSGP